MAEGVLRSLAGDRYDVFSAGGRATSVNPLAIRVMDEIGIDIRGQYSKTYDEFLGQPFEAVITVCDQAAETCPFLPGAYTRIHWSIPDPAAVDDEAARLQAFRNVRDELIKKFRSFIAGA
jgi:arsenate reductase